MGAQDCKIPLKLGSKYGVQYPYLIYLRGNFTSPSAWFFPLRIGGNCYGEIRFNKSTFNYIKRYFIDI